MDFRDVTGVAGFVSVLGILGSGFHAAVEALPAMAEAATGNAQTVLEFLATNLKPLSTAISHIPGISEGAGMLAGAFTPSAFLGGVLLVAGLCVAVPWALDVVGKALDGATNKIENSVEKVRLKAEDQKLRQHYQESTLGHAPVHAPAAAQPFSNPLAEQATARGFSHAANYQAQQDPLAPAGHYKR